MIRRADRISTVLRHDETLVEVFTAVSPVFERLRNPTMRKVMSRLVTVEQAARIAGVDPDLLVARLNGRAIEEPGQPATASGQPASEEPEEPIMQPKDAPPALAAIPPNAVVEIDVRQDLLSGHEPFSKIMASKRLVPPGGALRLRAIFEPVPLYAVMEKQGLAHHTERITDDDWVVWFYPAGDVEPATGEPATAATPAREHVEPSTKGEDDAVVILDVRDLEPPEPMVRTLEALETLPPGATLVQLNARVPQFLLPRLEERGFTYEIREQSPELVRLFIRRREK